MRIYRVIDDGTCVLTTVDELSALRRFKEVSEKHDVTVAWVDSEELR